MTGPIQIKRDDVAADIRALADLTGTSITDAVAAAVRAQLARERAKSEKEKAKRQRERDRLLAEIHKAPRLGPPLTNADLYDENGLPR